MSYLRPTACAAMVAYLLSASGLAQPPARAPEQPAPQTPASPAPASAPAAAPEQLREAVLHLQDGRVFSGLLLSQDDKQSVLEIAGVPTTFKAGEIERTRVLRPILERYQEMRAAVPAEDLDQRMSLINWLVERRQLDLAVLEAEVLVAKNPKSSAARRLLDDLAARQAAKDRPKPAQAKPAADPDAPAAATSPTTADDPAPAPSDSDQPPLATVFPLLNAKQINLIRVFEVDLASNPPPRVIVPKDAVKELIETYTASPLIPADRAAREAIVRQDPILTLDLIYRLRARDFYDKVQILDQPESLRRFRDDVHRVLILNSCATSDCHGGTSAGRLVFSTFRANSDPTVYTNFYLLQQYRTASGEPLLNYEHPERSLLLQYALPRDIARARHPVVPPNSPDAGKRDQWRPALQGPGDRRLEAAVDWIKSLYRPRPNYELEYEPFRPLTPPPAPKPVPVTPGVER
jgi:hypothetical protein